MKALIVLLIFAQTAMAENQDVRRFHAWADKLLAGPAARVGKELRSANFLIETEDGKPCLLTVSKNKQNGSYRLSLAKGPKITRVLEAPPFYDSENLFYWEDIAESDRLRFGEDGYIEYQHPERSWLDINIEIEVQTDIDGTPVSASARMGAVPMDCSPSKGHTS